MERQGKTLRATDARGSLVSIHHVDGRLCRLPGKHIDDHVPAERHVLAAPFAPGLQLEGDVRIERGGNTHETRAEMAGDPEAQCH